MAKRTKKRASTGRAVKEAKPKRAASQALNQKTKKKKPLLNKVIEWLVKRGSKGACGIDLGDTLKTDRFTVFILLLGIFFIIIIRWEDIKKLFVFISGIVFKDLIEDVF